MCRQCVCAAGALSRMQLRQHRWELDALNCYAMKSPGCSNPSTVVPCIAGAAARCGCVVFLVCCSTKTPGCHASAAGACTAGASTGARCGCVVFCLMRGWLRFVWGLIEAEACAEVTALDLAVLLVGCAAHHSNRCRYLAPLCKMTERGTRS